MTICDPIVGCGRDKAVGGMTPNGWVCGECAPQFSAAMQRNRGNGMHRNDHRSFRGRRAW